jgi:hypothetical protein
MNTSIESISLGRRDVLKAAAGLLSMATVTMNPPATAAPAVHEFDFLFGRWAVTHRKLRERLAGNADWYTFPGTLEVAPILGGQGNFDRNVLNDPQGSYEAHSLRLFDAQAKQWSIYWLDARSPSIDAPVVGGFTGRKGEFFVDETFKGRPVRVRTTYESLDAQHAQWTQAFSPDRGRNWEVNWIMDFRKERA